jgi:hypothetical protein
MRRKDGKKIQGSKHIVPSSAWGKEINIFKPKPKKRPQKELMYCTGVICRDKDREFKNKAPESGECSRCYAKEFEHLRISKSESTPTFDTEFLTRYEIV